MLDLVTMNIVFRVLGCRSPSTGMNIEAGDGSTANAHKALGCITFALLLLQVGIQPG